MTTTTGSNVQPIRLGKELESWAKAEAKKEGRSLANFIRFTLEQEKVRRQVEANWQG